MRKTFATTGALLLVIATFIIDLGLEPGVIHGVPFVVLISMSFWLPWRFTPPLLALIGSLLVLARYYYLAEQGETEVLGYNVAVEVAVLWITAMLVMAYRNSSRSLEDREKRLKALIETAVDGVIIIDALGKVQEFNPACERLFGYREEEVIGNNVRMLMPSPYREEHDRYLSHYRTTGVRRIIGSGREVEGRRKNGSTFPMELSVGEARPGGKQVFVGIIRDVTARHAAEQSLRIAKEQAEAANRAKSVFLANMSHEIRTPMNAVLGYTQVLENDDDLPKKFRQPLKAIRSAGNHLIGLIDEILDLSKIEAGAMQIHARGFDLLVLLEEIAQMFQIRCEQKGLDWHGRCDIQHSVVVGDDRKLRQVLINLLGNAVKFTDSGSIRLEVEQHGDHFRFLVADTGPGISEQGREHLFEPFHQAEQGAIKGGTGLGLALTSRHIKLLGGELELHTAEGEGCRFEFTLELPRGTTPTATAGIGENRRLKLSTQRSVRALVVDDVEDNREVLCQLLESTGISTLQARDGNDALDKLRQADFDVVFMDIRMPGLDGIGLLKAIHENWPEKRPVCIAITASGLLRHADYYTEAGFDDYLAKPFLFEQIWKKLAEHLHLEFTEQPDAVAEIEGEAFNAADYRMPQELYQRLKRAAKTNALSAIEEVLDELRGYEGESRRFAERLARLAADYDMQAIEAELDKIKWR
jgi:PAS domain S-box-containing protein